MKKISKGEIKRIKDKLDEQYFLEYLLPIFGISTLVFFGIACIGHNNFSVVLSIIFCILFILNMFGLAKYTLTSEEKETYKKFQAFEEAEIHKKALDTYNKLNKVFN